MASLFGLRRGERQQESKDSHIHMDPDLNSLNELSISASWWGDGDKHSVTEDSLREHLREKDEHTARLQDMLRCERDKCRRLQLQCRQQEAELRQRELHASRLKERLAQLTDGHRKREAAIEVLNAPHKIRSRREQVVRPLRAGAKHEDAALRVMLERREAELRENMKLRHSLTSLLHALRVDMEQTLLGSMDVPQDGDGSLDQAEEALGEYVTGGVVRSWRQAQKKLHDLQSGGQGGGTDHEKFLNCLLTDLKESQDLVRSQQQLLQDGLVSPLPSELSGSYFLEEMECLRLRRAEFERQRRTFEKERTSFTDAAIRLGRERWEFEQQKAFRLKQLYLSDSPSNNRSRSSTLSGFGRDATSGHLPVTPSSMSSIAAAAAPGSPHAGVGVRTPSTPELFSALGLRYD